MVALAHTNKHWYTAREIDGIWHGIVYHYDHTGNKEIFDHKTVNHNSYGEAIDAAVEWAEDNNIEVELG